MPIYNKTPPSIVGNHNTAEIDYHTSEAAKVKRTREQAYFNSYDFDAIEVLPYDDDEDDDGDGDKDEGSGCRGRGAIKDTTISNSQTIQLKKTQQQQQQHSSQRQHLQQLKPLPAQHSLQQKQHQQHLKHLHPTQQQHSNHSSFSGGSSSSDSFIVDSHQRHVNSKYNPSIYLQRLTGVFANKSNNNNNKLPHHHLHHNHQQSHASAANTGSGTTPAIVVVVGIADDNKHLKLSSSETSLSSSSVVKEVLSGCSGTAAAAAVGGVGGHRDRDVVLECANDVVGSSSKSSISTTTDNNVNTKGGNDGHFLLPRAMLKYQSTALVAAAAIAPGITTATTNSMPLATAATNNNNNSSKALSQQLSRVVHKTDGVVKGITTMLAGNASGGIITELRTKKNSATSSITTSINSEDLVITEQGNNVASEQLGKTREMNPKKVLPKTINPKSSARASSHQSHYSTDKSASSGYYSSNVCSTYSLEEHIYSEPTIDIKDVRNHTKQSNNQPPPTSLSSATTLQKAATLKPAVIPTANEMDSVMRSVDLARRYRFAENDTRIVKQIPTQQAERNTQEFNENLKILESSIENLDRHLKSFPGTITQDAIVAYVQNPYSAYATVNHTDKMRSSSYNHLPTIQEGLDVAKKQPWLEDKSDDSLMDIDLDAFLLNKDKNKLNKRNTSVVNLATKGIDNPSFLTEEQEENHYKCAKYINSCPEDAYRVESDILAPTRSSASEQSVTTSGDIYPKRYEEQLHFQNTRELLEDVRDKIRQLTHTSQQTTTEIPANSQLDTEQAIPKELNSMIGTLKQELELYLQRMNQNSELEIRQLCTGLVKNQHIVKMRNAFERRRSLSDANDICSTYEAIHDGIIMNAKGGVPISIRQQITSIRCSSDPNFKMKRKSLTEVFPMAECYIETIQTGANDINGNTLLPLTSSQLHRNLNYHKPVLEQLHSQLSHKSENLCAKNLKPISSSSASGGDTSETNDKESILDWHRKKPSNWEMYYGTNRIQQSLLGGKKNGTMVATATASSPSTMCYPSSRPESDFTLDLPRAEQLRIKMEKEKKFRHRCRVITTFLSLVFFLLTVMVVSLVLTRGKRMFGSMI